MIKQELFKEQSNGVKLYRTYSDKNFKIKQIETGIIYDDAIDLEESTYTYEETNYTIEEEAIDMKLIEDVWKEVTLNELNRT